MSLISTKNLIAPFTNKLHIITIVLFTIGFVALRLSGGAVRAVPADARQDRQVRERDILSDELSTLGFDRREADGRERTSKDLPINRVVEGIRPPWEEKRAVTKPQEPGSSETPKRRGGLDDIEKALGIK
ncbi:MAG: hypothetical protein GX589_07320 [Deltaproteobacteria bacterium]|nr:hypothetical protein [Deltaproteobacteria bacterium]